MNKTDPPNIKYIGKIPVRLNGARGWIQPGQTLTLPDKIVNNLILDKENWEKVEDIPQETEIEYGEPPGEEKRKKKKEVKQS